MTWTSADISWKRLLNKRQTDSTNKAFYNPANLAGDIFTTIGFCGATNTYGTYPNSPTLTQNNPTNTIPLLYIR